MHIRSIEPGNLSVIHEIARLRSSVWIREEPKLANAFPGGVWLDWHDDHARHWVVEIEGKLVAAARLCIHNSLKELPNEDGIALYCDAEQGPFATMNRLVVLPEFRNLGIAKRLDDIRLAEAERLGARCVFVVVPTYRVKAVQELGFEYIGLDMSQDIFSESGISFYILIRRLS